jgi:type II secretory pathway pseudopilin PulG
MGERQRSRAAGEQGYLMVALLVAISVMAIMMTAALPAWHTMARREKEAELVFRGEQYARALGLYQRKIANAAAPSIDFLVEQRFLRKKYKDPITNDDFQVLTAGTNQPGQVQGRAQGAAPTTRTTFTLQGSGSQQTAGRAGAAGGAQGFSLSSTTTAATGGVVGVTSKSSEKSLRLYNGRDTYNEWVFMPVARGRAGGDGGPAGGRGADGRGGRGADGRGGRGADGRGGFDLNSSFGGRGRSQGDGGRGRGAEGTPRGRF